ncbi:MAG: hypothetical protein ABIA21_00705 [Candidatus Aenigmatarchaeota archaeon]
MIHKIRKVADHFHRKIYGKQDRILAAQTAAIGGIFFGLSAVFFKMASTSFDLLNIVTSMLTPFFIIGAICSLFGGLLLQVSLKHGRASLVLMTTTGLGAIIPVVGGLMMGEILLTVEAIGVVLIIAGVLFTVKDYRE